MGTHRVQVMVKVFPELTLSTSTNVFSRFSLQKTMD